MLKRCLVLVFLVNGVIPVALSIGGETETSTSRATPSALRACAAPLERDMTQDVHIRSFDEVKQVVDRGSRQHVVFESDATKALLEPSNSAFAPRLNAFAKNRSMTFKIARPTKDQMLALSKIACAHEVEIWNCSSDALEVFQNVSHVQHLVVTRSYIPKKFDVGSFSHLKTLYLSYCDKCVQGLATLKGLKRLMIFHCEEGARRERLYDVEALESLQWLRLDSFENLRLLDVSKLVNLQELSIGACPALKRIVEFEELPHVHTLTIRFCPVLDIKELLDVAQLQLRCLFLESGAKERTRCFDLSQLTCLENLTVKRFQWLFGLTKLTQLKTLDLRDGGTPNTVAFLPWIEGFVIKNARLMQQIDLGQYPHLAKVTIHHFADLDLLGRENFDGELNITASAGVIETPQDPLQEFAVEGPQGYIYPEASEPFWMRMIRYCCGFG